MSFSFFGYQTKLIGGLAQCLTRVRRVVGQLATGGGKTVIFSGISYSYIQKNNDSVLILVHRKKLLKQARKSLYNLFKIDCQIIIAGMQHVPYAKVYVGMIESVKSRLDKLPPIGLVIADEAHIANFNKVLQKHFTTQKIIGFTATPITASKKHPLKDYYDDIVCGVDIAELIALNKEFPKQGLVQNITFAPKDIVDRAALQVSQSHGDFQDGQMSLEFSKTKYVQNTVKFYEKHAKGTKTIVFNVNIDHSKLVCDAFVGAGYDCKHIDSEMNDTEQTHILNWYKHTPNAILCNVGILTTGFDEPSIETVIINRSTISLSLWLQMCGRGSRPFPSKMLFTIIDLGGNAVTLGDWCDARDWYDIFWNPPKPGDPKDQPAPVKSCPNCDAIIPAPSKVCRFCGYEYPNKEMAPESEKEIDEMVVITKGIDAKKLIEKNKDKKKYFTFYEIGRRLAKNATSTVPSMDDNIFEYIYNKYIELSHEWAKEHNQKLPKFCYEEARKTLSQELEKFYPEWAKQKIIATAAQSGNQGGGTNVLAMPVVEMQNIKTQFGPMPINRVQTNASAEPPDFSTFITNLP
jgi:superfamily II DNA or RNA helicase